VLTQPLPNVALGLQQAADNPEDKAHCATKAAFCNFGTAKNGQFEWLPVRRPN
jgi:hypothetical protein